MAETLETTLQKAELAWYRMATDNEAAERDKFYVEKAVLEEDLTEKQEERQHRLALARARRVFDFVGEVTECDCKNAVDELNDWVMMSKDPITVRFNSPGGSAFDGLFLYDYLRELAADGIHLTTKVYGIGASMGSVLPQAGTRRLIAPHAWFMVHEPSTLTFGKASAIKDEAALMKKLHRQLVGILAERSTLSAEAIIRRCDRKDWWMPADEAVKYGFFDGITTD